MKMKIVNIFLLIICVNLFEFNYNIFIKANPIVNDNFQDDWNYRINPHNVPLLNNIRKNHILPENFKTNVRIEKNIRKLERSSNQIGTAVRSLVSCPMCRLGVGLLLKEVEKNTTFEDIKRKFVGLCVGLKVESLEVCTGIFDVYGPDILMVVQKVQFGATDICGLVLGETCGDLVNPLHEWDIELPNTPKPNKTKEDLPKEGLSTFKVLQISDTHYDPDYVVGSVSNCEEPLCCRISSTPKEMEDIIPAGKWGSTQKCDSPKVLIDSMLKHIAEEHPDIDYILWTGDLPPHDIWNQTKESNLNIIYDTIEQMYEIFPGIPIFPALGNHESIPPGNFPPPWVEDANYSVSWLYNSVADYWRRWLPASVGNTLLHGGFYSVLIRPGFRLIALNTNYCHSLSWWLLLNSTDPAKELKWLIYELEQAESKGEKVHLIGHIPPGSTDCMKVWSRNFYKIVERYEDTIKAQFYGHSHADEFEVFYDSPDIRRPTNVAYLGPSVTTFSHFNPAYRIYYVDGDHNETTREIIDHETWTIDLNEANQSGGEPKWYKLYSARKDLKLESLRPEEWAKLIDKLTDDADLFDLFYKFYYRDSPTRSPCDSKCKLQILCDLRSAKSQHRHELCKDLELIF